MRGEGKGVREEKRGTRYNIIIFILLLWKKLKIGGKKEEDRLYKKGIDKE